MGNDVRQLRRLGLCGLMAALSGCDGPGVRNAGSDGHADGAAAAEYRVVLHEPSAAAPGGVLAEGTARFPASFGDGGFEGTWELTPRVMPRSELASKVQGAGRLTGTANATGLTIDLHPGVVDHNLELVLNQGSGAAFVGMWHLVTDAGVEASGSVDVVPVAK